MQDTGVFKLCEKKWMKNTQMQPKVVAKFNWLQYKPKFIEHLKTKF